MDQAKKFTKKANICFDCKNSVGGCSWSMDFTPVPGWTAERVLMTKRYTSKPDEYTYSITACPLFERG